MYYGDIMLFIYTYSDELDVETGIIDKYIYLYICIYINLVLCIETVKNYENYI